MAITIPTYGPREVAPIAAPTVRVDQTAPIENFGGGQSVNEAANAAGGLAKATNDIFMEQKRQADNAVGQDVYAKLTQKKNDLIYDPQTGAMTKKGQDALDVTNTYGSAFNDYADKIGGTLQNDEQRRQFEHFRRVVGDELNGTLTKYTYGESQNLQAQIADSALKSAQNDAILNYHEPDKVEQSVQLQSNLLTNTLSKEGMPQDVIDQKVAVARSQTYAGVIDRMLVNGQDMQAKAYYDQVKDKIVASDATAVEKSIEAGSMRGESQRKADDITDNTGTLSEALDKAREIEDPKLRDETTRRVKDYFSDQEQAKKTDEESRFNDASQILEKTKSLDAITPQMMANLSSAQRRALEVRYTQLRDGIEPAANGPDKYDLQTMAATPELRDKFLATNLMDYQHKIPKGELSQLMATQASMRKSDGEADDTIRGLRTRTQIVNETTKQLGVDKDASAVLTINRQLDDQIAQFGEQNKKKPSSLEVQKMLDNIVVQAKDPNSGFFGILQSTGPAYSFKPNTQLTVNVNDVPLSEKKQIQKALTLRGLPVTDDAIVDLYTRKLNGARQRGQ